MMTLIVMERASQSPIADLMGSVVKSCSPAWPVCLSHDDNDNCSVLDFEGHWSDTYAEDLR